MVFSHKFVHLILIGLKGQTLNNQIKIRFTNNPRIHGLHQLYFFTVETEQLNQLEALIGSKAGRDKRSLDQFIAVRIERLIFHCSQKAVELCTVHHHIISVSGTPLSTYPDIPYVHTGI